MAHTTDHGMDDTRIGRFIVVWLVLVIVSLIQVFVARATPSTKTLLAVLGALALFNAALVLTFFMHLKYERRRFVLSVIPALIFVLVMMSEMVPDSVRLHNMKAPGQTDVAAPPQQ
jgi:cytochrome c oxidase subunit IV